MLSQLLQKTLTENKRHKLLIETFDKELCSLAMQNTSREAVLINQQHYQKTQMFNKDNKNV